MDKIYQDAKDLHVVSTKVYAKSNDTYAYADSACTKKISAEDLQEMYLKGMQVISGTSIYAPVSLKVESNVATVTYVTANNTTAVLATLKSE